MEENQIKAAIIKSFDLWKGIKMEDIIIQKMNGITNSTYKASVTNSNYPSIIFRKFGPAESNPFLKRESQAEVYQKVFKMGLGPRVYYQNQEFRLQQFINSTVMQGNLMLCKQYGFQAAFALRKFHEIQLESNHFEKASLIHRIFLKEIQKIVLECSNKMQQLAQTEQERQLAMLFKKWISKQQLSLLGQLMQRLNHQELVFCHNDPLPYNILIEQGSKKIMLIDYEYAGYNYPIYDLAYYITESYFNYEISQWPYFSYNHNTQQEEQANFIKAYAIAEGLSLPQFRSHYQQTKKYKSYPSIEKLMHILPLGKMMVNLVWGYWRIMAGKDAKIPFDYCLYFKNKAILMENKNLI